MAVYRDDPIGCAEFDGIPLELKNIFELSGRDRNFCEINDHILYIRGRMVEFIHLGELRELTEGRRLINNSQAIQQIIYYRSISLFSGLPSSIKFGSMHSIALIARAYIEGLFVIGFLSEKIQAFLGGRITFERICDIFGQVIVSSGHSQFEKAPKPINILTMQEKTRKLLASLDIEGYHIMIDDSYAWLSDFCHPNFMSHASNFRAESHSGRYLFRGGSRSSALDFSIIETFCLCFPVFVEIDNIYISLVNQLRSVINK